MYYFGENNNYQERRSGLLLCRYPEYAKKACVLEAGSYLETITLVIKKTHLSASKGDLKWKNP